MQEKTLKEIAELIRKYDFEWSWYTDYPSAGFWKDDFQENNYKKALQWLVSKGENYPISLYFHFPFCPKRCYFCVCPSDITTEHKKVNNILKYQFKEIDMLNNFFNTNSFKPNIQLVHFGGGSPSFMNEEEIESLVEKMSLLADIGKLKEFSIEIDPRTIDKNKLVYYSKLGINRISFGIQDFDLKVQKAVNRVQSIQMVEELLSVRNLFKSVNFDLIYGMPFQTRASFRNTVNEIIRLSPDKISLNHMFYKPELLKHQKLMVSSAIPNFDENTMIFLDSVQRLSEEGYVRIGIDHFAKPTDILAIALKNKTLGRSPMGHTHVSEDSIGIGPWAMGRIANYYSQNNPTVSGYCDALDSGKFPVYRGYVLEKDDQIRRDIIKNIICFSSVHFTEIEEKYEINFKEYFKEELESLNFFVKEGMLEMYTERFNLTYLGRFFQRHICTCFDKLFKRKENYKHSRNISGKC